jgi:hypothetical protein
MVDDLADFAASTVAVAPSPQITGRSLVVQSGEGAYYPTPPFDVTMSPPGVKSTWSNSELGVCTNVSGDTLTITRGAYGSNLQVIAVGWTVENNITKNLLMQILAAVAPLATSVVGPDSFGASPVVGTSSSVAREDHNHGLPDAALPPWYQIGTGSPVGVVVPYAIYALYRDDATDGTFIATGTTDADWLSLGGNNGANGGLSFITGGAGFASVILAALGAGEQAQLLSGVASGFTVTDNYITVTITGMGSFNLFISAGDPNTTSISAIAAGDWCVDVTNFAQWVAQSSGTGDWSLASGWKGLNAFYAGSTGAAGVFLPMQHATSGAPAYVEGGMYYDTTLHKLRIGGLSAWETVTSV